MKKVSVREFQSRAAQFLGELPFILTRYNLPVAVVTSYNKSVDTKSANTPNTNTEKCEICGNQADYFVHEEERGEFPMCLKCISGKIPAKLLSGFLKKCRKVGD